MKVLLNKRVQLLTYYLVPETNISVLKVGFIYIQDLFLRRRLAFQKSLNMLNSLQFITLNLTGYT